MFLVVARWFGWTGGWAYGPRLLADAGTLLAFLAIPVAEEIRRSRTRAAAFGVCLAWSVAVQVVGAFAYDVTGWNERVLFVVTQPGKERPILFTTAEEARREVWAHGGSMEERKVNVDTREGQPRVWSIRDNQILYYVEHFLQARRLKQVAIEKFLKDSG